MCYFAQVTMLKRIASAAAAASIAASAPMAMATPSPYESANNLLQTVADAGVRVYLQCPEHIEFAGMYASTDAVMAICADGGRPDGDWTANDLDTLRHEAIHLAQDCWGRRGDGELETTRSIMKVIELMAIASERYGMDFSRIEQQYRRMGADDMTILLEFEAWAGAAVLTNEEVEAVVEKACMRREAQPPTIQARG